MNDMTLEADSWRVSLPFTKASGKETRPSMDYDMVGRTFEGICETLEEIFSLMDLENISEVALHASVRYDLTETQTHLCSVQFKTEYLLKSVFLQLFHFILINT